METLLHLLCSTLPARLLAYAPFLRSLRFGKWAVAISVICSQGGELLLSWAAIASGHPEWVRVIEFLFAPIAMAIVFLNIKMPPSKLLFFYLFVIDYLMIVVGLSSFCAARLLGASSRSWQSSAFCLLVYLLTWFPVCRFFRGCVARVERTNAPALWRVIWLVPALTTAIVLIFTGSLDDALVGSWGFLFTRVGLLICVLAIYWIIVQSLDNLQKQAALEKRLSLETHLLSVQIEEQRKHGKLLMENAERIRRQRRELRHQLTYLQELADTDPEKLLAYLSTLIGSIPAPPEVFCKNEAVNAIVSHYSAVCKREGVELSAELSVLSGGAVPDNDLCVVFGNLLENAVEACSRMAEGRRFITLRSAPRQGLLIITMDNSYGGSVREENGQFYSSKRESFGIGLSSVRAVARKYGGEARFEYDGAVFSSSVYMKI